MPGHDLLAGRREPPPLGPIGTIDRQKTFFEPGIRAGRHSEHDEVPPERHRAVDPDAVDHGDRPDLPARLRLEGVDPSIGAPCVNDAVGQRRRPMAEEGVAIERTFELELPDHLTERLDRSLGHVGLGRLDLAQRRQQQPFESAGSYGRNDSIRTRAPAGSGTIVGDAGPADSATPTCAISYTPSASSDASAATTTSAGAS